MTRYDNLKMRSSPNGFGPPQKAPVMAVKGDLVADLYQHSALVVAARCGWQRMPLRDGDADAVRRPKTLSCSYVFRGGRPRVVHVAPRRDPPPIGWDDSNEWLLSGGSALP